MYLDLSEEAAAIEGTAKIEASSRPAVAIGSGVNAGLWPPNRLPTDPARDALVPHRSSC